MNLSSREVDEKKLEILQEVIGLIEPTDLTIILEKLKQRADNQIQDIIKDMTADTDVDTISELRDLRIKSDMLAESIRQANPPSKERVHINICESPQEQAHCVGFHMD